VQIDEYPQPDIRGPMPKNAHPDSTFSSHLHNDWTQLQLGAMVPEPVPAIDRRFFDFEEPTDYIQLHRRDIG